MNNQAANSNNSQQNTQKLKTLSFLRHLYIPFTTIIGAIGIVIGFMTAVHWSILVTGNTGYTGYAFSDITTSMVLILFAFILAYSALPFFFSGYIAVKIPSYKKIEKIAAASLTADIGLHRVLHHHENYPIAVVIIISNDADYWR